MTEAVARMCSEKMFLKISQKFTGKHLCQRLFFSIVAGSTFSFRTPPVAASEVLELRKIPKI